MPFKNIKLLAGCPVPDSHNSIPRCAGNPLAVRAEGKAVNMNIAGMTCKVQRFIPGSIPDSNDPVRRPCRNPVAIETEGCRRETAGVAKLKRKDFLTASQIPDAYHMWRRDHPGIINLCLHLAREASAIRADCLPPGRAGVALKIKGMHHTARFDLPCLYGLVKDSH